MFLDNSLVLPIVERLESDWLSVWTGVFYTEIQQLVNSAWKKYDQNINLHNNYARTVFFLFCCP